MIKWRVPLLALVVFAIMAGTLGMTEDEAYYWVLSQKLTWGYAYHPPGIAWVIRLSEVIFSPLFLKATPLITRLPSILITFFVLVVSGRWLGQVTGATEKSIERGVLTLLSFAGLFTVSWMVVPDLPMLLGWMICFLEIYRRCYFKKENNIFLFVGGAIALTSKYSAIFILPSAFLSLFTLLDRKSAMRGFIWLIFGMGVGLLPNLIWNAEHQWGPFRYQFLERHQGAHFIFSRYLRFWLLQFVLAGTLVPYSFRIFKEGFQKKGFERFIAFWILPCALVFWIQPAFSDFKFHWSLMAWLPAALALAVEATRNERSNFAKVQRRVGLSLMAFVLISYQLPIVSQLALLSGKSLEAKYDITNDVTGWKDLKSRMLTDLPKEVVRLPWVGGRYQTASLAAYSKRDASSTELIPRDEKALDEWPMLGVVENNSVQKDFLYFTDNRYAAAPQFLGGKCTPNIKYEFYRMNHFSKWIQIYFCKKE